jgi:DNA (cytosine-5)-methyltransferase 1
VNGELRQAISAKWSKGSSGPSGDEYMNLVVEPSVKSSRSESAEDPESPIPGDVSPTIKGTQPPPAVATAYSIREDAQAGNFSVTELDHANALSSVRRLTPIECERLMGWPDDHTRLRADGSEQADSARFRQIGNGVAAPVARWIGEQIRPLLEQQ